MISKALRAVWDEPRVPAPATRPWWDIAVVAVLVPSAVLEGIARNDVPWPAYTIALSIVCALAVLWRAQYPLGMLVLAFGAQTLAGVGPALAGLDYGVLNATAVVLLFPYSLARWGSGRHIAIGVVVLMIGHFVREPLYGFGLQENLIGAGFLLFPVALGAAVRFFIRSKHREAEEVRIRERNQLARELHDTVAHHVSGIVIQARAGRILGATDTASALDVLPVIEQTATTALADMRSLVAVLRDEQRAERNPVRGVADLLVLADDPVEGPAVTVDISGDVEDLPASVDAAVFRIAQESVTNARWHAHDASRIEVRVRGEEHVVSIDVVDDGRPGRGASDRRGSGFGIPGMRERAEMLGGNLTAGPCRGRGWRVTATIPRKAPR